MSIPGTARYERVWRMLVMFVTFDCSLNARPTLARDNNSHCRPAVNLDTVIIHGAHHHLSLGSGDDKNHTTCYRRPNCIMKITYSCRSSNTYVDTPDQETRQLTKKEEAHSHYNDTPST